MMKICVLKYTGKEFGRSFNLGDEIQTLAVSGLLPRVDGYVAREALNKVKEKCVVPMNGFFMESKNWPPSSAVKPLFFGFHISKHSIETICSPEGIDYLKKWAPIGCRDHGTMKILSAYGIEVYYSRCASLTFQRRDTEPRQGEIFIVGVRRHARQAIPKEIRRIAIRVDQAEVRLPINDFRLKLELARQLLKQYSKRAKLVITSKIHCAMPCIAMGIPVVFLYDDAKRDDYRVKIIDDLVGINYVKEKGVLTPIKNLMISKKIDWYPPSLDLENLKLEMTNNFQQALERTLNTG